MKCFRMIFIILSAIFLFQGCDEDDKDSTYNVKYEVIGTGSLVTITMNNATGGSEQYTKVLLPWTKEFSAKSGTYLHLNAINDSSAGRITVTIYVNGNVFKTATSEGSYAVALADGTLS